MKECINPFKPCPFRFASSGQCNLIDKNTYFCLDEEEHMSEVLEAQEKMKGRGVKDIRRLEGHIKDLSDYSEICPSAEVLDRIMDAIKELRKARLKLMERHNVDIDDLMRKDSL